MLRRATVYSILLLICLLNLGLAGNATAVVIDPSLQKVFSEKAAGEMVRIVMIMDDSADLAPISASLGKAALPETRRQVVVAALQAHSAETQAEALAFLAEAERTGQVKDVRSLWLSNAIAFRGNRDVVAALAATNIKATLVFDLPWELDINVANLERDSQSEKYDSPPDFLPNSPAIPDTAWSVTWIDANRVWLDTGFTGAGIIVAHFDTGVWLAQQDIRTRLWTNPGEIPNNGIDDDGNGYTDDVNGYDFAEQDHDPNDDLPGASHGTHTAGTVCGDGTGGTITGVAPGANVMVCKVFFSDGTGAPSSVVHEAKQYAILMGARVFTASINVKGINLPLAWLRNEREVANVVREAGVIYCNSAGNYHFEFDPPHELGLTARVPAPWIGPTAEVDPVPYSSMGGVVSVGGTGFMTDGPYSASSHGPAKWDDVHPWYDWPYSPGPGLIKPDVVAPAANVYSLAKPSGYTYFSGTSMSCPHVAGLVALMLEKNPTLSPAGVDSIMELTAVELGTAGKDNTYGSGRIDALAAVNAVPLTQYPLLFQSNLTVLDANADGIIDPGESFDLIYELTNNSASVNATGITGGLVVLPNDHVTVTDGSGSFPDIAFGGGTGDNSGNVFSLTAAAETPQGYPFTVALTVFAQNGYQQTFDTDLFVGLPELLREFAEFRLLMYGIILIVMIIPRPARDGAAAPSATLFIRQRGRYVGDDYRF